MITYDIKKLPNQINMSFFVIRSKRALYGQDKKLNARLGDLSWTFQRKSLMFSHRDLSMSLQNESRSLLFDCLMLMFFGQLAQLALLKKSLWTFQNLSVRCSIRSWCFWLSESMESPPAPRTAWLQRVYRRSHVIKGIRKRFHHKWRRFHDNHKWRKPQIKDFD